MSGNPGGRPKGLAGRIRDATNDGHDLVDYAISVFENEGEPTKMRMEAATWLADRGFGRPALPTVEERRPEVMQLPENREELLAELTELEQKWGIKALREGSGCRAAGAVVV